MANVYESLSEHILSSLVYQHYILKALGKPISGFCVNGNNMVRVDLVNYMSNIIALGMA